MALIAMLSNTTIQCAPTSMGANRWGPSNHSGSTPCVWIDVPTRRQALRRGKRAARRMRQQQRGARDAVSKVHEWWTWLNDVVALGNDALHPSWNLLPVAQAQPQGEVCDADGDCGDRMPVHAGIDQLRRFAGSTFTLHESEALQQRPDRSLDGVVVLIADPDHYGAEVQQQIDRVVGHAFRAGDFLFVEFPDRELDQNLGLCRGIPRRQDGRHGGSVGIDSAKLRGQPLAVQQKLHSARLKRLGRLLALLGRPRDLDTLTSVELIELRRKLDVEAERPSNKPTLLGDTTYMALLADELQLSADYTDSLKVVRDKRSQFMARKIASQVHKDADESPAPSYAYIATIGGNHIDEVVAELRRKNVDDVLVLCHGQGTGHGELCG